MYESEANYIVGDIRELPEDILQRFRESRATVTKRSLIPWSEHCTECVWPTCYTTCDLFEPRQDGRCRRFVEGMVRIDCPGSINGYLVRIAFKRWARLWSVGTMKLYTAARADSMERWNIRLADYIHFIPVEALQNKVSQKRYSWKKRWARRRNNSSERPNCFLVECYNPAETVVSLTLTIRNRQSPISFQFLLAVQPGYSRHRIGIAQIMSLVDLGSPFDIDLAPNEVKEGCTLYFGAMDFVVDTAYQPAGAKDQAPSKAPSRVCKCVVWDLDNTLWDGILIEDGQEKLKLKPGIAEILKALDERGILISAVSKNNYDDAMAVLKSYGIADYFLFPQISWNPKSEGIHRVASSLNIGVDSILLVDDSVFEREEVKAAHPGVMLLDASGYRSILDRPDCKLPVTEESRKRRTFYREQQVRDGAQKEFSGDYRAFLRDCDLHLTIRTMTESTLDRVHELTQRTNQMNFSGNRYDRSQLEMLMKNPDIDTYVLDCEDRFGAYGTVGFCTVNRVENRMTDLMFSCRIQAKRVEHAFLTHILRKYRERDSGDFYVNYRKTERNAPSGKVFDDFGFQICREVEGLSELAFPGSREIPDDAIVTVEDKTTSELIAPMHT
jgi:FkbH-like protein